ncbi:MAG: succinate dehydrogenase, cytochrome b556 subunit [Gammaproteobacteria bacterium]
MQHPVRPLSPHLQIYRWQLTSVLSILHRVTGIFLALGLVGISLGLYLLAFSTGGFADYRYFLESPVGLIFLVAWSWSFFYHLLNGVRHLFWDMGSGFELKQVYQSGWIAVIGSLGLVLVCWLFSVW